MTSLVITAGQREPVSLSATVFVVDHDPEAREAVCSLASSVGLDAEPYGSANEFLEAYDPRKPGCLVLEVVLPGVTGLVLQKRLAAKDIRIPIIFTTSLAEVSTATKAMRAGALDFYVKPFSEHDFLESIYQAISVDRQQRREQALREELDARVAKLTKRQHEVMQLLAQGASSKAVASHLNVSRKTVDNHRSAVMEKLGARNVAHLIRLIAEAERTDFGGRTKRLAAPRVIDPDRDDAFPIDGSQHIPTVDVAS